MYTFAEVQAIAKAAQDIRDVVSSEANLRVRVYPAIKAVCASSVEPEQIDATNLEVEFIQSHQGWCLYNVIRS